MFFYKEINWTDLQNWSALRNYQNDVLCHCLRYSGESVNRGGLHSQCLIWGRSGCWRVNPENEWPRNEDTTLLAENYSSYPNSCCTECGSKSWKTESPQLQFCLISFSYKFTLSCMLFSLNTLEFTPSRFFFFQ